MRGKGLDSKRGAIVLGGSPDIGSEEVATFSSKKAMAAQVPGPH